MGSNASCDLITQTTFGTHIWPHRNCSVMCLNPSEDLYGNIIVWGGQQWLTCTSNPQSCQKVPPVRSRIRAGWWLWSQSQGTSAWSVTEKSRSPADLHKVNAMCRKQPFIPISCADKIMCLHLHIVTILMFYCTSLFPLRCSDYLRRTP